MAMNIHYVKKQNEHEINVIYKNQVYPTPKFHPLSAKGSD